LSDYMTNAKDMKQIVESNGFLIQKADPIYLEPSGFWNAHYYAPSKAIFGKRISTISANVMVIWLMTASLIVLLAFDGLKKFLNLFGSGTRKE
ncbi:MAG: hypothetical protein ACKO7B_19725, partial [Flavobacteriales bacterium]